MIVWATADNRERIWLRCFAPPPKFLALLGTLGDISSVDYIRSEKIGDKLWKPQIGS